jgi:hypothetical protein
MSHVVGAPHRSRSVLPIAPSSLMRLLPPASPAIPRVPAVVELRFDRAGIRRLVASCKLRPRKGWLYWLDAELLRLHGKFAPSLSSVGKL